MSIKRSQERQPDRIAFARDQRQQSNEFSRAVWQMVRSGHMLGKKFRREYPVGPYTLDFACIELMLDIEIDGKDHLTKEGKHRDAQRDAYLRKLGYTIQRIKGFQVTQEPLSVRHEIELIVRRLQNEIPSPTSPEASPSPPLPFVPQGRGEQDLGGQSEQPGTQYDP